MSRGVDKRVDRGVCAVDPSGSGSRVDIAHIEFSIYLSRGARRQCGVEFHVDKGSRNERRQCGGEPTSTSRCDGGYSRRKIQVCAILKQKRSGVDQEMRTGAQMRAHRVQSESDDDVNESVDDRVSESEESNATRVDRRDESGERRPLPGRRPGPSV